ncbi:MAG: excinuclease ABC subunit UvrA, partial [Gammaproteobacteria bacterium]|nr:excinuclease ABC subunit UvrA [Gammaproteobacteria bacterium]
LRAGAIKPFQTPAWSECQDDLMRHAEGAGIPRDTPWNKLTPEQQRWVIEGTPSYREGQWSKQWYGVRRFFAYLESKAYKMHIRVLLSKYRSYTPCPSCGGARLKLESLLWRVGSKEDADAVLEPRQRFMPQGVAWTREQLETLPGLCLHDLMLLPIDRLASFFNRLHGASKNGAAGAHQESAEGHFDAPSADAQALKLILDEIQTRLKYLTDVGIGYLTLDRQSRTLSGGEVQRINLTTALGTSLVNTLFVLDEPSIGLHARDLGRVVGVLERLRDAGNTLVVVEHDPQLMRAADHLLDMGPGPGERGGTIVYQGPAAGIRRAPGSLTGEYLSGRRSVAGDAGRIAGAVPGRNRADADADPAQPWLQIRGAAEHNLKGIDVGIPLGRLVCVTGVSGSGKSTLIEDVLYRGLRKLQGRPTDAPGAHESIAGHDQLGDVVLVDQAPIGRTTRSNPASYVGAFDAIRRLFAADPESKARGYTAGTFSFNAGNGRCPACGGNGFEHVEMQFLADVYLRCPDCDGRRYRTEILEIGITGTNSGAAKSIADVLDMTVAEALGFFGEDCAQVRTALAPLAAVGLDYLRLGQPAPTLSGGEAQRLKLAGHLARHGGTTPGGASRQAAHGTRRQLAVPVRPTLFLFDEPTTGLHFADIARLLQALHSLIAQGHTVVVIEHNLDVIAAADWIIDLGPEGGDEGGRLVCAGTPARLADERTGYTGAALRQMRRASAPVAASRRPGKRRKRGDDDAIVIRKAHEHNLQGVDVTIPRDCFTVITGVSGSGKSTLAFDILFGEGQRRYLETLNAYARQFVQPSARPDFDAVAGIPPTVAIEQRTSRGGRKSTVGTLTEIHHFLRLLYVKLGVQHCPDCEVPIDAQTPDAIVARMQRDWRGRKVDLLAPLVVARKGYYTDLAGWAARKGCAWLRVDGVATPTVPWPRLDRFREHDIDLPVASVTITPRTEALLRDGVQRALELGKGMVRLAPASGRGAEALFSTRRACPSCGRSFAAPDPRLFSYNSRHGWCARCYGTGLTLRGFDAEQTGEERWWTEWWEGEAKPCRDCNGRRLNREALAVRFEQRSIAEVAALTVSDASAWFKRLKLRGRAAAIARDALAEIRARLAFLGEVGLDYLSLDRAAPTLSGGEAQRIRLAAQLGSNLRGVCYILDEPTIGLHPRDNRMLIETLTRLEAKGNTVVVVEHDEDTIRAARHLIDLGPGAGADGGHVVATGSLRAIMRNTESVTGRALRKPLQHPLRGARRDRKRGYGLRIRGADLHNLRRLSVDIPLGLLVCVTGVSGSGKSTLVREVLHANLAEVLGAGTRRGKRRFEPRGCATLAGIEHVARVLEVDQTPIGKTPRSCPATYVGIWDHVRRLFAQVPEARLRGFTASRFSFNVAGGRCPVCEGQGVRRIEMSFLPNVEVPCDACGGARFEPETLAVRYRGRSVAEVLGMSVDEAVIFFSAHPPVHHALELLQDVGLGYLRLGQPSPTLSGGEAQRIKLVTELAKAPLTALAQAQASRRTRGRAVRRSLYVLDEPTVGLHMADVEKLVHVLHRLVDAGNSVVLIEHNLDVIAEADWIVDLGPEGGAGGGRVIATGTPEDFAKLRRGSHTARVLREFLSGRGRR